MKRTSVLLLSTTTVYRGCRILLPETIKNSYYPKCVTCKHFIPDSFDSTRFSKCKKFGKANLVSGEIAYDFADSCREMESKCGQYGRHYTFDEFHKAKKNIRKIKLILPIFCIGLSPFTLFLLANSWNC
jgi:hypothetical protein